jgi:hypothetical protein
MTDIKITTPVGQLVTVLKPVRYRDSVQIRFRLKTSMYQLTPWLYFLGVLHG